ncbi:MAG TPA: protein phosphatase 2C domain-containing protein [Anaerolineae bacterium]|nr:protein phosphatase 2C domain-containing protein [Anaerolineae bacterium]
MTTAHSQVSPEIECSGLSHIGSVREDNQDAIRLSGDSPVADRRLFALADGMGGYSHGGLASQTALEIFFETFYGDQTPIVPRGMRRSVDAANLGVFQMAQRLGAVRMGTTLTAVAVAGNQLHIAHVGDSRAYLIRDHRAQCLTNDHTHVGDMVRMKVITPDKVRTHAQRSILTKGLGLGLFVQPDITQVTMQDGDRLVLCCDGIWSVVEDQEFAHCAAQSADMNSLSERLVNLALERQSDDNLSVVAIHLQQLGSAETAADQRRSWNPFAPLRRRVWPL